MTEREEYIEEVGIYYENYGFPRIAGRILGYLMSSDSDNNSFDEIKDALIISKGSASSNINILVRQKMIEKHSVKGSRKSFYRIDTSSVQEFVQTEIDIIRKMEDLYLKGNTFKNNRNTHSYIEIEKIGKFCKSFANEMEEILKRITNSTS